jgi:glycerophosphoryl diester phosphodiesterase
VVAHRAANDPDTLARQAAHADVVEADVHLFRGRLEVRHARTLGPLPILWERWYLLDRNTPRHRLETVLAGVAPEVDLLLDLKGRDPRLPRAVMRAVEGWPAGRRLLVSSRVWRTVDRLRGVGTIETFHSVGSRWQLGALLRRYRPGALEGVAIHRRLLSPAVVAGLRERAPQVWSWPVDDPADAATLAGWGVTGFISDAPALLRPRPGARARYGPLSPREAGGAPRCPPPGSAPARGRRARS